jgi:UDP-sugar pyrophosphorylase
LLLAPKSVLLLDGPDISIKNLRVDGALVVRAVPGAKVVLDGLTVSNQGWTWTQLDKVGREFSNRFVTSQWRL